MSINTHRFADLYCGERFIKSVPLTQGATKTLKDRWAQENINRAICFARVEGSENIGRYATYTLSNGRWNADYSACDPSAAPKRRNVLAKLTPHQRRELAYRERGTLGDKFKNQTNYIQDEYTQHEFLLADGSTRTLTNTEKEEINKLKKCRDVVAYKRTDFYKYYISLIDCVTWSLTCYERIRIGNNFHRTHTTSRRLKIDDPIAWFGKEIPFSQDVLDLIPDFNYQVSPINMSDDKPLNGKPAYRVQLFKNDVCKLDDIQLVAPATTDRKRWTRHEIDKAIVIKQDATGIAITTQHFHKNGNGWKVAETIEH